MIRRRPTSLMSVGLASFQHPGRPDKKPLSLFYPEDQVRRVTSSTRVSDLGWKLTAVETPRDKPAPYRFVVIAGSPSWSEYWAEFLSNLPQDREMIVVDRPGFGASGPKTPVHDIRLAGRPAALLRCSRFRFWPESDPGRPFLRARPSPP